MRILYLTSSLSPYNGFGRYSRALVGAVAARGHEPVVLAPAEAVEGEMGDLPAGVRLCPALKAPRRYWQKKTVLIRSAWAARRLAADCALVHCLVEPYYGVAGWAAAGRPLVLQAIGAYAVEPFLNRRRAPWGHARALRRAECVVACSHYTLERLKQFVSPRRAEVIPLGVDEAFFESGTPRPGPDPLILSIGALKPRKGVLDLVRAAELVIAQRPSAEFHIVGDDTEDRAYAAQCRALIAERRLASRVFLRGRLKEGEVAELARRAWCFALCPRNVGVKFEGFGLVYLEAAARGLPIVASRGCGAEEFVRHEETGLLAAQGDAEAIAEAIMRLLGDPVLRARLGEAGRHAARANSWARCSERLEGIYLSLAAGSSS